MRTFAQKPSLLHKPASSRLAQPSLGHASVPPIVRDVLASPGEPLDVATRAFMEPPFGHDFGQVRVHAAPWAAASAAAVNAQAYTVGQHIVLGAGHPSPESPAGRLLLAHELVHVVQQSSGSGAAPEISPAAPHEAEARDAASDVVAGRAGRVASRTGVGLARQPNELEAILGVARDLVEEKLGVVSTRLEDLEEGLRIIGGSGGQSAAHANGLLAGIAEELNLPGGHRHLRAAQEAASDFLRRTRPSSESLGRRGRRLTTIIQELERAAVGSGPDAAQARQHLERIRSLRERVSQLEETRRGTQMFQAPGEAAKKVKTAPKVEPKVPAQSAATAGAKAESAVGKAASTEIKAATKVSRVGSGLAKFGSLGFHALLPGPLDALALMVQFAGSYAEAKEAIRDRNTRTGFAIGLSANLLGRSHRAVRQHLSRKFVLDREVHTQIVGAVGIAEKAHNNGLDAGFHYGERLSDDAKDALRDFGLSALLAQGRLPASKDELFSAEGVWKLAGALHDAVDQIFKAMQAEAERQQEEERRKRRQETHRGMKF